MGPNRPYLLRAFYQWLLDNECTPHLVVNADVAGVQVPQEHVKEGQIVLNIAPHAIGDIEMSNERVMFSARFSGKPFQLIIPMAAIVAIYARENGEGTMFEEEDFYHQLDDAGSAESINTLADVSSPEPLVSVAKSTNAKKDRSFLTVIK